MFGINNYGFLQVHGGAGGHEGGVVEMINNFLVFIDDLSRGSSEQIFAQLLPGIAGIPNIHPLVVHFPIALLSLFFIVDLIASFIKKENLQTVAAALLYMGTFFAAVTVYFGFQAAETVGHDEVAHIIMEKHEGYGVAILSLAFFLSIWRALSTKFEKIKFKPAFLSLAALLNILLIMGADLGGLMVYQHGVGVRVAPLSPEAPGEAHDHHHDHGEHDHQGHEH